MDDANTLIIMSNYSVVAVIVLIIRPFFFEWGSLNNAFFNEGDCQAFERLIPIQIHNLTQLHRTFVNIFHVMFSTVIHIFPVGTTVGGSPHFCETDKKSSSVACFLELANDKVITSFKFGVRERDILVLQSVTG